MACEFCAILRLHSSYSQGACLQAPCLAQSSLGTRSPLQTAALLVWTPRTGCVCTAIVHPACPLSYLYSFQSLPTSCKMQALTRHTCFGCSACRGASPALAQVFDVGAVSPQGALVLKEVAVFLAQPLPDAASALGVYVSVGGQQWQFRGYVANGHPSECAPLASVLLIDALVGTRDSLGGQQLVPFGNATGSWPTTVAVCSCCACTGSQATVAGSWPTCHEPVLLSDPLGVVLKGSREPLSLCRTRPRRPATWCRRTNQRGCPPGIHSGKGAQGDATAVAGSRAVPPPGAGPGCIPAGRVRGAPGCGPLPGARVLRAQVWCPS